MGDSSARHQAQTHSMGNSSASHWAQTHSMQGQPLGSGVNQHSSTRHNLSNKGLVTDTYCTSKEDLELFQFQQGTVMWS